jgi:hypothetical protein
MDRVLIWDEPLIVFTTIHCFLVFNFEFYVLQRYCTKVAPLCAIGAILLQMCLRLLATFWKNCYRGKRVLATLWQICNRVSEVLGNLWQIPQRELATFANSNYLPEGCQHPLILGQRVLITLKSNCQRVQYPPKKRAFFENYSVFQIQANESPWWL